MVKKVYVRGKQTYPNPEKWMEFLDICGRNVKIEEKRDQLEEAVRENADWDELYRQYIQEQHTLEKKRNAKAASKAKKVGEKRNH